MASELEKLYKQMNGIQEESEEMGAGAAVFFLIACTLVLCFFAFVVL